MGITFATLTNNGLKIIFYHQTTSSIYNWEFDCKHLSHLWFGQVSFDHILFSLTMILTMLLTTKYLIQFWPCLFQRLSCNAHCMTGSEIWDRVKTGLKHSQPYDSLFHMLFKNRMQKLHCMEFNKAKHQIHCNSFSKLCCSFISAYNFTFCIKIASKQQLSQYLRVKHSIKQKC